MILLYPYIHIIHTCTHTHTHTHYTRCLTFDEFAHLLFSIVLPLPDAFGSHTTFSWEQTGERSLQEVLDHFGTLTKEGRQMDDFPVRVEDPALAGASMAAAAAE